MSQEITNYLSPDAFRKFLDALILLPRFNTHSRNFLKPLDFQYIFKITYYCALRISETLNLTVEDFNLDKKILYLRKTKTGKGKIQKTTIPAPLVEELKAYLDKKQGGLFPVTRQTIWVLSKAAGIKAKLSIGEEQKIRSIDGIWTHLFRKSYSKFMRDMGASREIRQCKLRHSFKDSQDTYDAVDINTVKAWENRTFQGGYI